MICSENVEMPFSSTAKLYVCELFWIEHNNTTSSITTVNATSTPCGECYRPEYVVFTWILCLVALTSILKLYYLIKTFLAAINYIMYCSLLIRYYTMDLFYSENGT